MQLENLVLSRKSGSIIEVTCDVPVAEVESLYKRALQNVTNSVRMPGFRKGKAPANVIEREYGSEIAAMAEDLALENLLEPVLKKAGVEVDDLVARPLLSSKSEFRRNEAYKLELKLNVAPSVEPKEYEGLKLTKKSTSVTPESLDAELMRLAESRAVYAEVDRVSKDGDRVAVNASAKNAAGESVSDLEMENYVFAVGSGSVLPEFNDNIAGLKAGDSKDFDMTFPSDYHRENLKGLKVTWSVAVTAVKEPQIPKIDDEFAKDHNFENLEDLKGAMTKRLAEALEGEAREDLEGQILDQLREANPVGDLPEAMLGEAEAFRWERLDTMLQQMGLAREDFFKRAKRSEEEYKAELLEDARRSVHARLLLRAIGRKHSIEASDNEYAFVVTQLASREGKSPEAFWKKLNPEKRAEIKTSLIEKKVLDFLRGRAEIKEG